MRTRNSLERLAAVAPAEPLLEAGEEDRILERIVASDRSPLRRRRPIAIALVAATVVGAAVAAVATYGHATPPSRATGGHHPTALTGARIEAAGYHFRTPAGFTATSESSCGTTSSDSGPHGISKSGPVSVMNGFSVAASADGGCVAAFFMLSHDGTTPADNGATPVSVGNYQGYYTAPDASGQSALYVALPKADPAAGPVYLALYSEGLTEDQLIAVAQSGLPANP